MLISDFDYNSLGNEYAEIDLKSTRIGFCYFCLLETIVTTIGFCVLCIRMVVQNVSVYLIRLIQWARLREKIKAVTEKSVLFLLNSK
jgi:hypothetical protein